MQFYSFFRFHILILKNIKISARRISLNNYFKWPLVGYVDTDTRYYINNMLNTLDIIHFDKDKEYNIGYFAI